MELTGYLVNCFIGGEEVTHKGDGSWVRDKIAVSFAGYDISIVQRPEVIMARAGNYRGQTVDTTKVIVRNIEPSNLEDVIEKLQSLAILFSFITCSQVVLRGWECTGANPPGQYWSVIAKTGCFRPVLQLANGRAVREFLEQVCPLYVQLEQQRLLRVAINYYVSADVHGLPFELKLVTIFVLIENLKATFASYRRYPYVNGWFRRPSGGRLNFRSLLEEMFGDVGMAPPLDSIILLRNELIHSGISQMPYASQRGIYENCHDLIREYFMRLLGFSGSFFLYSGRGMKVRTI